VRIFDALEVQISRQSYSTKGDRESSTTKKGINGYTKYGAKLNQLDLQFFLEVGYSAPITWSLPGDCLIASRIDPQVTS